MGNKKFIIYTLIILAIILVTNYMSVKTTKLCTSKDKDYQNLGLEIEEYNIEYCTVYGYDRFGEYKIYKIKNYYDDSMDHFKEQLENSNLWKKNKFYEFIMMEFIEIKENENIDIDREDLYYYNEKDVYAIFDIKNAKLYYCKHYILGTANDYNKILDIKIDNYTDKEVYSVKAGWQGDGTDYFTYQFTNEKGEEIKEILKKNQFWSKEKLDENIINCFKHNEEINSIENAYYYYRKICRTSDENKKYNFTDEEATGYEVCIYDIDENKLYYYWTSI